MRNPSPAGAAYETGNYETLSTLSPCKFNSGSIDMICSPSVGSCQELFSCSWNYILTGKTLIHTKKVPEGRKADSSAAAPIACLGRLCGRQIEAVR
jgi:hypothetical protein